MKKEEPLINLVRGNPSSIEETTGSLSRPGRTVPTRIKKPALSRLSEFLMGAAVDETNTEPVYRTLL
jgi:hypothetical protein